MRRAATKHIHLNLHPMPDEGAGLVIEIASQKISPLTRSPTTQLHSTWKPMPKHAGAHMSRQTQFKGILGG